MKSVLSVIFISMPAKLIFLNQRSIQFLQAYSDSLLKYLMRLLLQSMENTVCLSKRDLLLLLIKKLPLVDCALIPVILMISFVRVKFYLILIYTRIMELISGLTKEQSVKMVLPVIFKYLFRFQKILFALILFYWKVTEVFLHAGNILMMKSLSKFFTGIILLLYVNLFLTENLFL